MRKARKRRWYEYTCWCSAYNFPHRFGGGYCSGQWVPEEYYVGGLCGDCHNAMQGEFSYCQVVNGAESPRVCPKFQDFVRENDIRIYK